MYLDQLTISILFGTGIQCPEIGAVLDKLPQLKLLDQTTDPQSFVSQHKGVSPDVVLVEMNGESRVPEWLENLPQEMPHAHVLVCSYNREPDFLIRAMQVGIREFLPLPLTQGDLESALNRVRTARKQLIPVENREGRIIVVTGHKGGAGSTTVAVNLAQALAESATGRIALIDLGRPFPDVGTFLDQDSNYSIVDLIQNIANLDKSFIQRIMQPYGASLSILHGVSDFREQDSIELESLEPIFALLRQMYSFIVIDLSHWLDELFIRVLTEADMALMLTGLTVPDLRNLKKLWPYTTEWHQDKRKLKIVVNRYDNSSGLQLRDLENILQHPAFATLPNDYPALMQCLNQGSPLMGAAPRSKLWRSIKELTSQILAEIGDDEHEANGAAAPRKKFWLF
ncbi:MAG: AAA family ATPase [Planctomycetes bacterium]|nr:AAA family ATPase [Planctomycetota bacterium]MCG2771511.1 AAA family ATPase [Desulfobacterales bacterium]